MSSSMSNKCTEAACGKWAVVGTAPPKCKDHHDPAAAAAARAASHAAIAAPPPPVQQNVAPRRAGAANPLECIGLGVPSAEERASAAAALGRCHGIECAPLQLSIELVDDVAANEKLAMCTVEAPGGERVPSDIVILVDTRYRRVVHARDCLISFAIIIWNFIVCCLFVCLSIW